MTSWHTRPWSDFHIFGQGSRQKYVFRDGILRAWPSGEEVRAWEVERCDFQPDRYRVTLHIRGNKVVELYEDEEAFWIKEGDHCQALSTGRVCLPDFGEKPYARLLRILHHEILINILPQGPLPNFFVYKKPWHRDAAMMGMALKATGNEILLEPWISTLREPFDRNNGGESEPDNLGQVLYLISLTRNKKHPLVEEVLRAVKPFEKNAHLLGRSDFGEHPVYQTKWMNFGLASLGLEPRYTVPEVEDQYGALFWWDRKGGIVRDEWYYAETEAYPYLAWAEAHFRQAPPPLHFLGKTFPLTWEAQASQADYSGNGFIQSGAGKDPVSLPHSWHAAEAFLYLHELNQAASS